MSGEANLITEQELAITRQVTGLSTATVLRAAVGLPTNGLHELAVSLTLKTIREHQAAMVERLEEIAEEYRIGATQ